MLTFKFVTLAKMGIDGQDYYAAAAWLSARLQKVAGVINPKWPLLLPGFNKRSALGKAVWLKDTIFALSVDAAFPTGFEELRICIIAPFLKPSYSKTDSFVFALLFPLSPSQDFSLITVH